MGGGRASSSKTCPQNGVSFCSEVPHASGCAPGDPNYHCTCQEGFRTSGTGLDSQCLDMNECQMGENDCQTRIPHSICKNTYGSYECVCSEYRQLVNNSCEPADMCATGGNCGANSRCVNHVDAPPTCKCEEGYTGNYDQAGVDCYDVDECETRPCSKDRVCVNTPGSYKCECPQGYSLHENGECVSDHTCTGDHSCDPVFADCIQETPTSYSCKCKEHLEGNGKKGGCKPMTGYEYLPCEIMGKPCTAYEDCVRESRDNFACQPQTTLAQLGTFFAEGASSDTPGWIWGLIGCVVLLIGVGIYFLYSKCKQGTRRPEHDVLLPDSSGRPSPYDYGAVDNTAYL